ncbi:methyltransferase domain-containing protein [Aureliella helgolandensis]|uniref:Arsenite methyltransferase n=1 Tax=Aureliella helgolandensis TaxID=2527968 RepID=A0A518G481_9BACT|nr:methyltransferase domain-containing protein [Aureliella helgolandensis]QDV23404.1 arsenite S-adenosylmethyltransferase [Aureliella helgolandensis]
MTVNNGKPNKAVESSVYDRYAAAAQQVEPALCCPVEYAADFLSVIPDEVIERDYGCGDPTPYVEPGDTVLDLGSGGGKLCFIAAQVVGESGRVIGVDCNREMLTLARSAAPKVAERVGFSNVEFRYGMIQDLELDLARLESELTKHPVKDSDDFLRLRHLQEHLRSEHPLVASDSIDCVVSNCVLNLVRQQDRTQLFAELFRVLRRGGRAAISDIVSDETVPEEMKHDPQLWSGCLSGAFREDEFLQAFEEAGFHGIEVAKRAKAPWQTINGIEFRSVTVVAYKGKQGPCLERNQAVVYRGPFKKVEDDDGHLYRRGERMAVCDKTFQLLGQKPYQGMFDAIEPLSQVPLADAEPFDCRRSKLRHPHESKGIDYRATTESQGPCCGSDSDCC